jgi:hypothetical protein
MNVSRILIILDRFFQVLPDKATKLNESEQWNPQENEVEEPGTKE